MAGRIEARLKELGIELPGVTPPKVAKILGWKLARGWLYVSGQIPQWNGDLRYTGKVGRDLDLATAQQAARLSALNVLANARAALDGDLDRIEDVVKIKGYVAAMPDFTDVPLVVNGASELFNEVFGEPGRHARTAIGVAVMPLDAAVEIEAAFTVR